MIIPMTKYSFLLLSSDKEAFMEKLQDLGVVDITRSAKPVDDVSRCIVSEIEGVREEIKSITNCSNARTDALKARRDELARSLEEARPAGKAAPAAAAPGAASAPAADASRAGLSRDELKKLKREEAERRNALHKKLKPLQQRYATLETELAARMDEQVEVEQLLADPEVYADAARSTELLKRFNDLKDTVDRLMDDMSAVEEQIAEIEAAHRGDDA